MLMQCDPRANHILREVSQPEFEYLLDHLELVTMSYAEVLYEVNDRLQYIYFPVTAAISLLCQLEDDSAVEVAGVGNEGALGVSAFVGRKVEPMQMVVHTAGYGYRISTESIQTVLNRSGGRRSSTLQKLLLRYIHALFIHVAQITACTRHHSLEQQLCRWLLLSFDRAHSSSLSMTWEVIAHILGVCHSKVVEAVERLQEEGVIDYHRGLIELKNRPKLEAAACECYRILKTELGYVHADSLSTI